MFVRFGLFFPIEIIRRRNGELRKLRQLRFADHHDPVGIGIIERPEQHRVDDGENRGAGADTEREREDGDDGEARRFEELTKGVAEVV